MQSKRITLNFSTHYWIKKQISSTKSLLSLLTLCSSQCAQPIKTSGTILIRLRLMKTYLLKHAFIKLRLIPSLGFSKVRSSTRRLARWLFSSGGKEKLYSLHLTSSTLFAKTFYKLLTRMA
jgi:hypothetical protein